MEEIFRDHGFILAFLPMVFAFGWALAMAKLPFKLIKEKRWPTIWDTLPFASHCSYGKAKVVCTVLVLFFLCFISMDYTLAGFFDAVLFGDEHWLVSASTIIIMYNWFGCLIYDPEME